MPIDEAIVGPAAVGGIELHKFFVAEESSFLLVLHPIDAVDILSAGLHRTRVLLDEDVVLIPRRFDNRNLLILKLDVLQIGDKLVILPRDVVAALEWPDRDRILLPAMDLQLLIAKRKVFLTIQLWGL